MSVSLASLYTYCELYSIMNLVLRLTSMNKLYALETSSVSTLADFRLLATKEDAEMS